MTDARFRYEGFRVKSLVLIFNTRAAEGAGTAAGQREDDRNRRRDSDGRSGVPAAGVHMVQP